MGTSSPPPPLRFQAENDAGSPFRPKSAQKPADEAAEAVEQHPELPSLLIPVENVEQKHMKIQASNAHAERMSDGSRGLTPNTKHAGYLLAKTQEVCNSPCARGNSLGIAACPPARGGGLLNAPDGYPARLPWVPPSCDRSGVPARSQGPAIGHCCNAGSQTCNGGMLICGGGGGTGD